MLMTTGISIEGSKIVKYLGIVSGECALGTGFFSSFGAGFADVFGTNSSAYSNKLIEAKQLALRRIAQNASNLGANAIIGMDLNYTTFTSDIMGVIATGTAVLIENNSIEKNYESVDTPIYESKNIKVKSPVLDGNIDVQKILLSRETATKTTYLAIGGKVKSGREIQGLLLEISLLSPFGLSQLHRKFEFLEIKNNGAIFTTNYIKLNNEDIFDSYIDTADVKLINIMADDRLLYSIKE
ncbi:MAG: YbjQ family protein [Oscillospiraceae bacterium]